MSRPADLEQQPDPAPASTSARSRADVLDGRPSPMLAAAMGSLGRAAIQRKLVQRAAARHAAEVGSAEAQQAATLGTSGAAGPLPHLGTIQRAFGHHDVTGIAAHAGEAAQQGAAAMGARAFAQGNHVAFGEAPDLHTAAHEAAHVVQQRAGVHLKGGVGAAGDQYEQHADAVADAVTSGRSAEALLDRHGGGARKHEAEEHEGREGQDHEGDEDEGGEQAAAGGGHDSHAVQRLIATTPQALAQTLGHNDPLLNDINVIGPLITTYNQTAQDHVLTQDVRIQRQIDQLRVLDRAVYAALDQASQTQTQLTNDPRVQALHTLLQESEADHRALVDTVASTPNLRNQVDAFDAANTGVDQDDLTAIDARALWGRIMDGQGKIQIVGPVQYQQQVRSWVTKLMDTKQGRRLLRFLDQGNANDLGTHTFIGSALADLPQGVHLVPNHSDALRDPHESVAQPLLGVNTKATAAPNPVGNLPVTNTASQYNDAVLNGDRGVSMNGQDYNFGQSSGSLVTMKDVGTLRTAAGVDRQQNMQTVTPEVYQPDWVLLGHELGHSANMKAGATTDGKKQVDNPTDVFSAHMSGIQDRDTRQDQWYGGSEEYINIRGNENRLRQQGGVSERDGHTSASGRSIQRMQPLITAAFREPAWQPFFNPTCPAELQRVQGTFMPQKTQILNALLQNPNDPNNLINATQLGNDTFNYLNVREQARVLKRQQVDAAINQGAWHAQLNPALGFEATLIAQFNTARAALMNAIVLDPVAPGVIAKGLQIFNFYSAWVALRAAHDGAGHWKQFKWKGWWDKAKRSVHNIGTAISTGDNARYTRKIQRVQLLTQRYA